MGGKLVQCEAETYSVEPYCAACKAIVGWSGEKTRVAPPAADDFEEVAINIPTGGRLDDQHVVAIVTVAMRTKKLDMLPLTVEVVQRDPETSGLPGDDQEVECGLSPTMEAMPTGDVPRLSTTYGAVRRMASERVSELRRRDPDVVEMYRAVCSCGYDSHFVTTNRKVAAVLGWVHRMANIAN